MSWVNNSLAHQFGVSFPPFLILIALFPYRDWGAEHWGVGHWDQIEGHTNWHYSGMTNLTLGWDEHDIYPPNLCLRGFNLGEGWT